MFLRPSFGDAVAGNNTLIALLTTLKHFTNSQQAPGETFLFLLFISENQSNQSNLCSIALYNEAPVIAVSALLPVRR
jgi:hypothetical protein